MPLTTTRTFGVEIECGYKDADLEVGEPVNTACGCEQDGCKNPVPKNNPLHAKALVKRLKSCYEAGTFSKDWSASTTPVSTTPSYSLTDGVSAEVRVGPVSGEEGLAELAKVMDYIRDSGGYVTKADGLHVHFGGDGYFDGTTVNAERMKVLLGTWANNREHVKTFVHPRRVKPRYGCSAWLPSNLHSGYTSKNMEIRCKVAEANTVEFRLLQGTLNPKLADAWVRFVLTLLDFCLTLDEPLSAQESPQAFLDALGAPDECKMLAEGYEFDHTGGECTSLGG